MKNFKFFSIALALVAMTFVACEEKGPDVIDPDPQQPGDSTIVEEKEDMPMLNNPETGFVTIALRAPEGTCNGMVAVGAAVGADGSDDWNPGAKNNPFTKVEGTESWYQITLKNNPGMAVKVIALTAEGNADWGTQWGMNEEGKDANVVILAGEAAIDATENKGEVKLIELPDASVVFVDVVAWKSAPCVEKNKAGKASFELTSTTVPEGATVGVIGNFNSWDLTKVVELTAGENNVYTAAEVEVPASCEYKYILKLKDAEGFSWDTCEDGNNHQMALDLKAVDTVEKWTGIEAK